MDQSWKDQHKVLQGYIMEISNNLQVVELVCNIQIVHTCMANSVHGSVENIPKYSISTPKSTQKHNTLIYDTDWSRTTFMKDIPSCSNLNLIAMYPYKTPVTLLTVCNHLGTRRWQQGNQHSCG